jgi:hypothetical protein
MRLCKGSPWLTGPQYPGRGQASQPPARDPRAERYFSTAARYNAAARALGYESLGHALNDGRLSEILRKASD